MAVFTDIGMFCVSILLLSDLQKCSLELYTPKHGVAYKLMLHSQDLNFVLVSLFLAEHTQCQILLHCISQCLLWLVSSLFSWIVDGACLPGLAVKTSSDRGSILGWLCHKKVGPPVNLWSTVTVGRSLYLTVHCVQFVPVTSSVSLSDSLALLAEMP